MTAGAHAPFDVSNLFMVQQVPQFIDIRKGLCEWPIDTHLPKIGEKSLQQAGKLASLIRIQRPQQSLLVGHVRG